MAPCRLRIGLLRPLSEVMGGQERETVFSEGLLKDDYIEMATILKLRRHGPYMTKVGEH